MSAQPPCDIRIAAIAGSLRDGNNTLKALRVVVSALEQAGAAVTLIDPARLRLGPPGAPSDADDVAWMRAAVADATGVLLATPEYHGSYSSTIKIVIDNLGFPSALAGKPVALLGVAAGRLGAVNALAHLRAVCSHVGALVLPAQTSVAEVSKVFDADGRCLDDELAERLRHLGGSLVEYIHGHICPAIALEALARGER